MVRCKRIWAMCQLLGRALGYPRNFLGVCGVSGKRSHSIVGMPQVSWKDFSSRDERRLCLGGVSFFERDGALPINGATGSLHM